jgi:hypothetical protein
VQYADVDSVAKACLEGAGYTLPRHSLLLFNKNHVRFVLHQQFANTFHIQNFLVG